VKLLTENWGYRVMGCYGWENDLSSQENTNLLQSGVSKLVYSTLAQWVRQNVDAIIVQIVVPGNPKIDSRESMNDTFTLQMHYVQTDMTEGIPHSLHGGWPMPCHGDLTTENTCRCRLRKRISLCQVMNLQWNNHCYHQACLIDFLQIKHATLFRGKILKTCEKPEHLHTCSLLWG
jgi:hypothetical protein